MTRIYEYKIDVIYRTREETEKMWRVSNKVLNLKYGAVNSCTNNLI